MQGLFVQLEAGRHETWLSSPVLLFTTCGTLGKAYNLTPLRSPLQQSRREVFPPAKRWKVPGRGAGEKVC